MSLERKCSQKEKEKKWYILGKKKIPGKATDPASTCGQPKHSLSRVPLYPRLPMLSSFAFSSFSSAKKLT